MMIDVFISYAREDKPCAALIAQTLKREGLSVWWDRNIRPGEVYDLAIGEALDSAKCVVVLWSKQSVASDWVKDEAEDGNRRGVLVPASIEEVRVPLGFRRLQTANLVGWKGDSTSPEFRQFVEAVRVNVGQGASPSKPISPSTFEIDEDPTGGAWCAELVGSSGCRRTVRINLSHGSQIIEYRFHYRTGKETITVDGKFVAGDFGFSGFGFSIKKFEFSVSDGPKRHSVLIEVQVYRLTVLIRKFRLSVDKRALFSEGAW
jgi:hypothetical protein